MKETQNVKHVFMMDEYDPTHLHAHATYILTHVYKQKSTKSASKSEAAAAQIRFVKDMHKHPVSLHIVV